MNNLAILSPSRFEESETFIQSHKKEIKANVFYYYGGVVPHYLEGYGLVTIDRSCLRQPQQIIRQLLTINLLGLINSKLNIIEYMLAKSLKRNKINVVLAEYGYTAASVVNVCKYAKIPLVAHFHGRDSSIYNLLEEYKDKYKQLFNYCKFVVVSHAMERKLVSLGCPQEKIVYAPCVPDFAFYQIRPRFAKRQFFSIGRFVDKKAPYATLLAFRKVLENHKDAKLIMAGDGPLLPTCRNLAHILGLEGSVFFPGILKQKDTMVYLEESLAFVQHSIIAADGDMEGTPVAVMEASAAGLPVISTRHAGIPEIIVDGETGLLCDELDADSMAENMMKIIDDEKLAVDMGRRGKERMCRTFSKEWQIQTLTDTINKAAY